MYCPKCGQPMPAEAPFCGHCGTHAYAENRGAQIPRVQESAPYTDSATQNPQPPQSFYTKNRPQPPPVLGQNISPPPMAYTPRRKTILSKAAKMNLLAFACALDVFLGLKLSLDNHLPIAGVIAIFIFIVIFVLMLIVWNTD